MTPEYLRQCFSYDASTGELFWAHRPVDHFRTVRGYKTFISQRLGKRAGCESETVCGSRYLKVNIGKKLHLCHRVVWVMVNGPIPDGMEVDHIDGDGLNNCIENLRLVTSSGNKKNRALSRRNRSGYHGIYWSQRLGKWVVQAWSDGSYLGSSSHSNLEDAISARKSVMDGHGFHPNHGRRRKCLPQE